MKQPHTITEPTKNPGMTGLFTKGDLYDYHVAGFIVRRPCGLHVLFEQVNPTLFQTR